MFFKTDDLLISITDVFEFEQENISSYNKGRNFNALSFRINADTQLYHNGTSTHVTDNSICFFPAYCDYKRIAKHDKIIVVHFNILNAAFDDVEVLESNNHEKLKRLFEQLLEIWNQKECGYMYKAQSVFYTILSECVKQVIMPSKKESPIYESVKYLENNFASPNITIKEIADKSYISEVYFRKLFKKIYGVSPIKYIIKLRLDNAVNLMQTGYYTLNETAQLCGYEDYTYFSSVFKSYKGKSPSEYIKKYL